MPKKNEITAIATWNQAHQTAEIESFRSNYEAEEPWQDRYPFLSLDQSVKDLFTLEYTDDGHVLSAKGHASNLQEWVNLCQKNLETRSPLWIGKNKVSITVTLPSTSPAEYVEIDETFDWAAHKGSRVFDKFKTHLQAERFLVRLWNSDKGLRFLDHDQDNEIAIAQLDAWKNRDTLQKWSLSSGYGDMRWSVSTGESENDESEQVDSLYIDFYPLPDWYGKRFAVQSAIDCDTGGFCEDIEADVVDADSLKNTLDSMLDKIRQWFYDNDCHNDFVDRQLSKVHQSIHKAVEESLS